MPPNPTGILDQMKELDGPRTAYAVVRVLMPHPIANYAPDEVKGDVIRHGSLSEESVIMTMNSGAARSILRQLITGTSVTEFGENTAMLRGKSPDEP